MKQMIKSVMAAAILTCAVGALPAAAATLPASPAGQHAVQLKDGSMAETVHWRRHHHRHHCYWVRKCHWTPWGRKCRWVRRCW